MGSELTLFRAVALAIIQGITEFVPVSSSGHLVLMRGFFGWSDVEGLTFDIILHGGSLAALLLYFRRDCFLMFRGALSLVFRGQNFSDQDARDQRRLLWLLVVATLPAAIAGVFFKPLLESENGVRSLLITGLCMVATSGFFLLADSKARVNAKGVSFKTALLIGLAQVVALLPGASRSGWTMGAGMLCGNSRDSAVRFAFLMAIPVVFGALLLELKDLLSNGVAEADYMMLIIGFVVSFFVSLLAIHVCVNYFKKHSLRLFAIYMVCMGCAAVLFSLL